MLHMILGGAGGVKELSYDPVRAQIHIQIQTQTNANANLHTNTHTNTDHILTEGGGGGSRSYDAKHYSLTTKTASIPPRFPRVTTSYDSLQGPF